MSSIKDTAEKFLESCETGKGWEIGHERDSTTIQDNHRTGNLD